MAEQTDNLLCQDTGIPIYNVIIGRGVEFDAADGMALKAAIRRGCERATREYPLRSSIVHPLTRHNAQTSCGIGVPVIQIDVADDFDGLRIEMIPKGSGSENNSWLKMAVPADGTDAVKTFVVDCVLDAGGRTCPPTIVGVGVGGTADLCVHLAKRAAIRPLGTHCADAGKVPNSKTNFPRRSICSVSGRRAGRGRHRLRRARRARRDAYYDEPGRGQHAVPLGATRERDDHAPTACATASSPGGRANRCYSVTSFRRSSARRSRQKARALSRTAVARRDARGAIMAHHELVPPIAEAQVRALRIDDIGHAARHAVRHPGRDADRALRPRTRDALRSRRPCRDPHRAQRAQGGASAEHPSGYAPVCIGTTTSARMERFTRPLLARCGVRLIIGKGGLGERLAGRFRGARWRLSGHHRRHRSPGDDLGRGDRGGRSRRSASGELVALPRARLRTAARGDGQPRRQYLRGRRRRGAGAAGGRARRARCEIALRLPIAIALCSGCASPLWPCAGCTPIS